MVHPLFTNFAFIVDISILYSRTKAIFRSLGSGLHGFVILIATNHLLYKAKLHHQLDLHIVLHYVSTKSTVTLSSGILVYNNHEFISLHQIIHLVILKVTKQHTFMSCLHVVTVTKLVWNLHYNPKPYTTVLNRFQTKSLFKMHSSQNHSELSTSWFRIQRDTQNWLSSSYHYLFENSTNSQKSHCSAEYSVILKAAHFYTLHHETKITLLEVVMFQFHHHNSKQSLPMSKGYIYFGDQSKQMPPMTFKILMFVMTFV